MTDKQKETVLPTDEAIMGSMAELQKAGFGSMAIFGAAWVESLSDLGAEVLSFVAERVKEDVKVQHELLHCKDIAQMQHIQAQFIQKAMDQYQAETGKLVEMSNSALSAALEKAKNN